MFRRGEAPCAECHLWACKCDQPTAAVAECVTDEPSARTAEVIEAAARILMADHAKIVARGFDTRKRRAYLHRQIDSLLDEWLMTDAGIALVSPS